MRAVCGEVRQKYANFMLLPLSEEGETASAGSSIASGNDLPVISTENAVVLSMLLRFISMPTMINYNPFFHSDPDKLILDLSSARLSYQSAEDDAPIEVADAVRRCAASITAQKARELTGGHRADFPMSRLQVRSSLRSRLDRQVWLLEHRSMRRVVRTPIGAGDAPAFL